MKTTLIAYSCLLVAALLDLLSMLRLDSAALQQHGFKNKRFYNWLRSNEQLTSPRRLVVLAVLVACCTSMARTSWMVIVLLAAVLAIQAIALMFSKSSSETEKANPRSWWIVIIACLLSLATAGVLGYLGWQGCIDSAAQAAAITAVILLALSPLVAMAANGLLGPKKEGSPHDSENQTENI